MCARPRSACGPVDIRGNMPMARCRYSCVNFARIEPSQRRTIISTMVCHRIRTLLIASFPPVVAAALCILGSSIEAPLSQSIASNPLAATDSVPLSADDPIDDTGPVASGPLESELLLSVPCHSRAMVQPHKTRPNHGPVVDSTIPQCQPARLECLTIGSASNRIAVRLAALPVQPHAPPFRSILLAVS